MVNRQVARWLTAKTTCLHPSVVSLAAFRQQAGKCRRRTRSASPWARGRLPLKDDCCCAAMMDPCTSFRCRRRKTPADRENGEQGHHEFIDGGSSSLSMATARAMAGGRVHVAVVFVGRSFCSPPSRRFE